jgi:DNA primase
MSISTFSGAVMHTDSLASLVARVDLAQLVEAYTGTPPRRSGGSFLFSCPNPAHPDRNPSFTVSRDRTGKEWARCQSACAWHGDALDLVKWLRGLDTKEAAQELRDFLGEYVPATYRAGVIPSNRVTPQEAHRLQVAEDTSRRLQGSVTSTRAGGLKESRKSSLLKWFSTEEARRACVILSYRRTRSVGG